MPPSFSQDFAALNPEDSKSNRAIGVALNDTACKVLRDQIGKHHKWVFVHTKEGIRPDDSRLQLSERCELMISGHGMQFAAGLELKILDSTT